MGIKRLLKKTFIGGGMLEGHIMDALQKHTKTGKPFMDCLEQSVRETITEDLPGTSYIYDMGKADGRAQGTVEQAARDEEKMKQMHETHEEERKHWMEMDHKKDELLDELEKKIEISVQE